MDSKFMRKLLLGMMILVILVLVEVQATSLTSITFHPSSVLILFPDLSKLDNVDEGFHGCFEKKTMYCQHLSKEIDLEEFGICILRNFHRCTRNYFRQDDLGYLSAKHCQLVCNKKEIKLAFDFGLCVLKCYVWHHTKH